MGDEAESREAYFAAAGERQPELRAVDALIRRHAPDLAPTDTGPDSMLGYGEQPYQAKTMKHPGVWPVLLLAAQKNYLSLYVSVVDGDGTYLAEQYAGQLGRASCGRSCIRFTRTGDLDADGLGRLLGEVNRRYLAGELAYGA